MANPIVTSIKGYVDQETNREKLIAKSVLGAKSASLFSLQTGVKGPTTINLLNTDVTFGDGSACGMENAGTSTITQRQIKPAVLKVNMSFCDRNLLQTYAQYQVKLKAGMETMPFEEAFTSHIVDNTKAKLENMIWCGDSAGTGTQFDGLDKIIKADGGVAVTVTGKNNYEAIKAVYAAVPEEAHQDDLAILVSPAVFRGFIQELIAANMYHYDANDNSGEYTLPGTNVRVISVNGLTNATNMNIVALRLNNTFYGTDLEGSEEEYKIIYDEVTELFWVKILFSAGVQVAFPTEIRYAKKA